MKEFKAEVFDTVRPWLDSKGYTDERIKALDAVLAGYPRHDEVKLPELIGPTVDGLTAKIALELITHEAIVPEWYKDSKGIGTWGIGVTSRSGHAVERYKDNPQPLSKCLEVYIWLLKTKYLPDVLAEFKGHELTEAQLGAALSFHYNTGAIRKASWVDLWLDGRVADAYESILDWNKPAEILKRRTAEQQLFFKGVWCHDGKVNVYDVSKPSYTPRWSSARRVDVSADVAALLGNPA